MPTNSSTRLAPESGPSIPQRYAVNVIPAIYVADLNEALVWYSKCLGFQVLAYNPQFATLEIAPGRICWLNQNKEKVGSSRFDLHIPDMAAFHRHLVDCGADTDELEEGVGGTLWFEFRDPDSNIFGAWSGLFGLNELTYTPGPEIARLERYSFVSLPEIHAVGISVDVPVDDPQQAIETGKALLSDKLANAQLDAGQAGGLFINPIIETYEGTAIQQVYICAETPDGPPNITGLRTFTIPAGKYAMFTFPREQSGFRAAYSNKYRWLGSQYGFVKPGLGTPRAVHLEYVRDDAIFVYFPYDTGANVTHDYK